MKNNIKEVALDVLDKYKDMSVDLSSEVAREVIAEDLSKEITEWIRNLYKEDNLIILGITIKIGELSHFCFNLCTSILIELETNLYRS